MPSSTKASPRWPRQFARVASAANCLSFQRFTGGPVPRMPLKFRRFSMKRMLLLLGGLAVIVAVVTALALQSPDRSRQRYLGVGCRSTSLGAFESGRHHRPLSRNQTELRNRLRLANPPLGMGGDFQWPVAPALLRARHRWVLRSDLRMGSHRLLHRSVDCLAILLPRRPVAPLESA